MADFLGLMKQAADLKSKMETMQAELDSVEVEGTSGGDMVKVTLSGKGELKAVRIDESLFKPSDREIVDVRRAETIMPQGLPPGDAEEAGPEPQFDDDGSAFGARSDGDDL